VRPPADDEQVGEQDRDHRDQRYRPHQCGHVQIHPPADTLRRAHRTPGCGAGVRRRWQGWLSEVSSAGARVPGSDRRSRVGPPGVPALFRADDSVAGEYSPPRPPLFTIAPGWRISGPPVDVSTCRGSRPATRP